LGFDADDAEETAAVWWQKTLASRAKRWRPFWDDANSLLRAGVDLRTWIREGLDLEPKWWRNLARWPDARRELWAERAAIVEVQGALTRDEAEQEAYATISAETSQ
jgi:hypothetical protein